VAAQPTAAAVASGSARAGPDPVVRTMADQAHRGFVHLTGALVDAGSFILGTPSKRHRTTLNHGPRAGSPQVGWGMDRGGKRLVNAWESVP